MKIIYMGTPDFAVGPLEALIAGGHEVLCVMTQADRPKGRGHKMQPTPVKEAALKAGIPVLQPAKMRDPVLWETLKAYGADLFVVAAYGKILPPEILSIPPRGCVNIHASLLPAYRGAAPIQHAVIDGQKETGITTMLMDEGLDTGDILRRYPVPVADDETGGSLFDKLAALGGEAILDTLRGMEEGSIVPEKQGEMTTPYAAMLTKESGNVDWGKSAEEIERLVRGLDPWPGAYSFLNGKMIRFKKTAIMPENALPEEQDSDGGAADRMPGSVFAGAGGRLYVRTGSGVLEIKELQPEGKKAMPADAYLRGARMPAGSRFTSDRS